MTRQERERERGRVRENKRKREEEVRGGIRKRMEEGVRGRERGE